MKLDNKGWGLRMMLFIIGVLVIFFAISMFFMIRLYGALDVNNKENGTKINTNNDSSSTTNNGNTDYSQIETSLESAAITYVKQYYTSFGIDTIIVKTTKLQEEGMVNTLSDSCFGYVLVDGSSKDTLSSSAYIKCTNYTTAGYQDWRI